ncbi:hypothetical protein GCM10011581_28850 [Saccharopolyspora subtropica]|uniref:Uncharacterized protein n=1 Tax=Saccharopolyspora thermophila TaxID=89367 RepID=A0A917JZ94_9PSEU|nr:hypothetical protein [Saccharopolyspora subtropica]GGI89989.1 hypothetical protein GCM10011581_28850 [Saccharopolyspora subtropica]
MFVVVVAMLLVLILGAVMFTDVLDDNGPLDRRVRDLAAQLKRDIRLFGHR